MIDVPRQTLREIIAKYGRSLSEDPKRCKALLRDFCGSYRREINVLIGALEERVGVELLAVREGRSSMPREVLLKRLTKRLEDNLALTETAARWAVDSWALALGVLSEGEVEAREREKTEKDARKIQTAPTQSSNKSTGIDERETSDLQPLVAQRKQTPAPVAPPPQTPPARRSAIKVAPPPAAPVVASPPQQVQVSKSNRATTPVLQPEPPADPLPRRRRRGKIRGCLFGCLLFIILSLLGFFAVPFIVNVLREEQQQQQPTIEQPRSP